MLLPEQQQYVHDHVDNNTEPEEILKEETLQSLVDHDVQTNSVRKQRSHSRNLLKIKCGLEFLKVLFEQVELTQYVPLIHWLL
ncbi:glycolipid transfer protein [Medicago truncatula]|uniref:Glycolipid transfer protein n=1 Tax=Medicago truncatula TaxID=3880 RepID=G7KD38_MEDTR|nr:glycolipid transfer protein [Medicago truncatula]